MESRLKISKDEFRAALGRFASGVTVVTTRDNENRLHGITVSAFCSVSLEPPLILVCIDKEAGSHYAFEQSRAFVVNILREDQQYLSDRFASQLSDKFDGVKYRAGIEQLPVLEDVLVNLECRLVNAHDNGDHTIYIGEIVVSSVNDGKPLIYFQGDYGKLGS
ncbi:MAG TPA: flavin reductase family protein [Pyrinomonadaceae bacterium]|jgi:flavin reductase (DIM6/NTAB) family NADH-FMN oxidoreductase RutF